MAVHVPLLGKKRSDTSVLIVGGGDGGILREVLVHDFVKSVTMVEIDKKVIEDFGNEWKEYNQSSLNEEELENLFNNYFNIIPFYLIDKNS